MPAYVWGMKTKPDFTAMSSRLHSEQLIRISQAAKLVPSPRGTPTNPSTLVRWILRGKRGVRLDGVLLSGDCWWTSRQALERFSAELTRLAVEGWEATERVIEKVTGAGEEAMRREVEACKEELRRIRGR